MRESGRPGGPNLRVALRAAADATDGLLRSLDGTDARTAGGVRIVRDTAAHLVVGAHLYASLLSGAPSPLVDRSASGPLNAGAFLARAEDRPVALADLLAAAVDRFDAVAAVIDPDEIRPWHRGLSIPVAIHVALIINELLMHGTDIARAAGRAWEGDERAAAVAWRVLAPWLTPVRFLSEVAGDLRVSVALVASGGPPLGFQIADGAIAAADPTAEVGCRIEGPAMPLLRWYFQRDPWPESGLRASGPEADVATRLADLLRQV